MRQRRKVVQSNLGLQTEFDKETDPMNRSKWLLIAAFVALSGGAVSGQEGWPQFRGNTAGVVADAPALPETWSDTEIVVWAADIPGL